LSPWLQDGWNPDTYPESPPRFASEYGFQTFPSFEVLKTVSEPFDWSIVSEFASHRQRHPYGNLELLWQIRNHMDLPSRHELLQESILGISSSVRILFG
jgi:beta-mannosidase